MTENPKTTFILSVIDLVSGKWKAIGSTSRELVAEEIAKRLSDDKQYIVVSEVSQLELLFKNWL
jgi:hypothetical protein